MSTGEILGTEVADEGFDAAPLEELLDNYRGQKGSLIPLLQGAQAAYGFLPKEAMVTIAAALGEPLSQVYGVATFYAQFRLIPRAKNVVRVCHGTACHVSGASLVSQEIERHLGIGAGENTADMMFTIENVACLGACGMAPVMMINDRTYGKLTPDSAVKAMTDFRGGGNGSGPASAEAAVDDEGGATATADVSGDDEPADGAAGSEGEVVIG